MFIEAFGVPAVCRVADFPQMFVVGALKRKIGGLDKLHLGRKQVPDHKRVWDRWL